MIRIPNGWASTQTRLLMALKCLQGHSVVFNTRFYLPGDPEEPIRITPISPTGFLTVNSCLFAGDPENPTTSVRLIVGDYIKEKSAQEDD